MVKIVEIKNPAMATAREVYKLNNKVNSIKQQKKNSLSKVIKVNSTSRVTDGKISKVKKSKIANLNSDNKKKIKMSLEIFESATSESPVKKKAKKNKKEKKNSLEEESESCFTDLEINKNEKSKTKKAKKEKCDETLPQELKNNSKNVELEFHTKKKKSKKLKEKKSEQIIAVESEDLNNKTEKVKKSSKRKLAESDEGNPSKKWLTSPKTKGTFVNGESHKEESDQMGRDLFKNLLHPISEEHFFKTYWEKEHLLIRAGTSTKFDQLISTSDIDRILRKQSVLYTKNIDITSYEDGERKTHNPEGRALASVVWDLYNSGCSVRMLNPQTFHKPVAKYLSTLREYFNSFCGANIYLTPPGTQGFAPHWDDIEAFVLQLEGKKRWKVYKPRSEEETLPRESSGNFGPADKLGEPVLDCVLSPGDVLYFPRGFIHQGITLEDAHSLHITISTYQKNAWVDLLEKLLPAALAAAAESDVEFRRGLPREFLHHAGIVHAESTTKARKEFTDKVSQMVTRMMAHAPIDAAVDQMAKGFIHDSLPPILTQDEKRRSVFEGGERWSQDGNCVEGVVELEPETRIKLMRKGCVRIVLEENTVRLYHSVQNSLEYHGEEPTYVEIETDMAPALDALVMAYPNYICIQDLPLETLEDKTTLAIGLWERGLLLTDEELELLD